MFKSLEGRIFLLSLLIVLSSTQGGIVTGVTLTSLPANNQSQYVWQSKTPEMGLMSFVGSNTVGSITFLEYCPLAPNELKTIANNSVPFFKTDRYEPQTAKCGLGSVSSSFNFLNIEKDNIFTTAYSVASIFPNVTFEGFRLKSYFGKNCEKFLFQNLIFTFDRSTKKFKSSEMPIYTYKAISPDFSFYVASNLLYYVSPNLASVYLRPLDPWQNLKIYSSRSSRLIIIGWNSSTTTQPYCLYIFRVSMSECNLIAKYDGYFSSTSVPNIAVSNSLTKLVLCYVDGMTKVNTTLIFSINYLNKIATMVTPALPNNLWSFCNSFDASTLVLSEKYLYARRNKAPFVEGCYSFILNRLVETCYNSINSSLVSQWQRGWIDPGNTLSMTVINSYKKISTLDIVRTYYGNVYDTTSSISNVSNMITLSLADATGEIYSQRDLCWTAVAYNSKKVNGTLLTIIEPPKAGAPYEVSYFERPVECAKFITQNNMCIVISINNDKSFEFITRNSQGKYQAVTTLLGSGEEITVAPNCQLVNNNAAIYYLQNGNFMPVNYLPDSLSPTIQKGPVVVDSNTLMYLVRDQSLWQFDNVSSYKRIANSSFPNKIWAMNGMVATVGFYSLAPKYPYIEADFTLYIVSTGSVKMIKATKFYQGAPEVQVSEDICIFIIKGREIEIAPLKINDVSVKGLRYNSASMQFDNLTLPAAINPTSGLRIYTLVTNSFLYIRQTDKQGNTLVLVYGLSGNEFSLLLKNSTEALQDGETFRRAVLKEVNKGLTICTETFYKSTIMVKMESLTLSSKPTFNNPKAPIQSPTSPTAPTTNPTNPKSPTTNPTNPKPPTPNPTNPKSPTTNPTNPSNPNTPKPPTPNPTNPSNPNNPKPPTPNPNTPKPPTPNPNTPKPPTPNPNTPKPPTPNPNSPKPPTPNPKSPTPKRVKKILKTSSISVPSPEYVSIAGVTSVELRALVVITDYYFLCPVGCLSCSTLTSCSSCSSGYSLKDGVCIQCNWACKSCQPTNSQNCSSCTTGFYLEGESCKYCVSPCATCSNKNTCLSCVLPFAFDGKGSCGTCSANCLTCTSTTLCTKCDYSYGLSLGACIKCMSDCYECEVDNLAVCTKCSTYTELKGGKCVACPANCISCSQGVCLDCSIGFNKQPNGTCVEACLWPCLTCKNSTCLSCFNAFELFGEICLLDLRCNDTGTCLGCPPSVLLIKGKCIPGINQPFCREWASLTNCIMCVDGFFATQGICNACPSACLTCKTDKNCISCKPGYYISMDVPVCLKCMSPCLTCLHTYSSCTSCEPLFTLEEDTCVSVSRVKVLAKYTNVIGPFNNLQKQQSLAKAYGVSVTKVKNMKFVYDNKTKTGNLTAFIETPSRKASTSSEGQYSSHATDEPIVEITEKLASENQNVDMQDSSSLIPIIVGSVGGIVVVLGIILVYCFCFKKKVVPPSEIRPTETELEKGTNQNELKYKHVSATQRSAQNFSQIY